MFQSNTFAPIQSRLSLRRLKTVFAPSSPTLSSASSTSPLSADEPTRFSFSGASTYSKPHALVDADGYLVRRKKSLAEIEQEDERHNVADSLLGLVEPRPFAGVALGGIEEIMSGRI